MIINRRLSRWPLLVAGLLTVLVMTALSLPLLSGCVALPSMIKPPLEAEGEVFVYLQPFPQEAAGLRFTVGNLSAVRSDGAEFPLTLPLEEFSRNTAQRQRLVASGRVPPG